jgi:hypothetical protein
MSFYQLVKKQTFLRTGRPLSVRMTLIAAICCSIFCSVDAAVAAPVKIGDKAAFDVALGAGKMTPAQRAQTIQKNVDNALVASSNRSPDTVAITYVNKQPVITLGGFYIASVDTASAQKLGITASALAQRWSNGLKGALANETSVGNYVAHLVGSGQQPQTGISTNESGSYPYYRKGGVIYIPAGMTIPIVLNTSLSSQTCRTGDPVQATLARPISLGDSEIPANSLILGQIVDAEPGTGMSHSGQLVLHFTTLQTPSGVGVPISAHIIGRLGKYEAVGDGRSDSFHGESTDHKIEDAAVRGAIGAGSGALLGTVVGAIASHGYGTGRGTLTGLTIGGAMGVADSLMLRRGSDINVQSGQALTLQLDAPAQLNASDVRD